jgi:hypothetical protein
MTLDLRRSEHGEYLTASPFQAGRCVWPGCTHPRSTDFTDEHNGKTYGLPLCPIHALETYHIVGRSRVMSNNRNSVAKPKLPSSLRIGHLTYTVKPDNKGAKTAA